MAYVCVSGSVQTDASGDGPSVCRGGLFGIVALILASLQFLDVTTILLIRSFLGKFFIISRDLRGSFRSYTLFYYLL